VKVKIMNMDWVDPAGTLFGVTVIESKTGASGFEAVPPPPDDDPPPPQDRVKRKRTSTGKAKSFFMGPPFFCEIIFKCLPPSFCHIFFAVLIAEAVHINFRYYFPRGAVR
jgi:hypothetical protein